ncbi:LysR family transcriptional regulator [Thalassospira marina]|uniref:LysR family transcriptional regulator n=1 Tax=Thalassospira marina TaxID=2048283 RepID=A0A2N3KYT7_9PROT|nr:LysR family transcriptional regulator [Thalassospira marina]PKR55660.1 LysR family transcriptional regulator [Thalassospira marina]
MELRWFEDYIALADCLNFSRAAQQRNITQPAFSRRIRALEAWVGTPLFERTTHDVSLTPAGIHFRNQAEALTRSILQLQRETCEVAGQKQAVIGLAATHALSFTFFPKWMQEMGRVMPLGTLNLISDSMQACEQVMLRGDAPFLLAHFHASMQSNLPAGQFKSIVIGKDRLMPLCTPDFARKAGLSSGDITGDDAELAVRNVSPGAENTGGQGKRQGQVLDQEISWLAYRRESGLGRIIKAHWAKRAPSFTLRESFTSHLAATLQSMAGSGAGVAWLPETLAKADMAEGKLVPFGEAELIIPIEIRLFRPVARQSPMIEEFWRMASQTMPEKVLD